MAIKDTILNMILAQENAFKKNNRYIQIVSSSSDLKYPDCESARLSSPLSIEAGYTVKTDVCSRLNPDKSVTRSFIVIAEKDLGDGVIETIKYFKEADV
jgi:hypothetical protein